MKQHSNNQRFFLKIGIPVLTLLTASMMLLSFTTRQIYNDVFSKLGLSKDQATTRITESLLGGYLNYYGIRNLRSIAMNDRAEIVKDLAAYTKEQSASPAFKQAYAKIKESHKPSTPVPMQKPEEMRADLIKRLSESVKKFETELKTANAQMKPIYENMLTESRKQLKDYQDPNNQMIKIYADNFKDSEKYQQESFQNQLDKWEEEYPTNHQLFIKNKLKEFLEQTEGIDFNAATFEKNGKKYFTDRKYEQKGSNWKMGFRAGKGTVEAARAFAKQWIEEIK